MNPFSGLLEGNSEFQSVLYDVKRNILPMGVLGLSLTPKAHIIDSLWDNTGKKALVITNDEASAVKICRDLREMGMNSFMYPARDWNFRSDESRSREYERTRLGVLGHVADNDFDAVVCSVEAAMQYTIPMQTLKDRSVTFEIGKIAEMSQLVNALVGAGYVRADMVEGSGQFAVRGDIIDFFPPDSDNPVRVEFWGDTVDSMAYFDIMSQRRGDNVDSIGISPSV